MITNVLESSEVQLSGQKQDEYLVAKAQAGDRSALNSLLIKYKNLIYDVLNHIKYSVFKGGAFPKALGEDDLIQEGSLGLFKAIRDYKTGGGATFKTYAWKKVWGGMMDSVKRVRSIEYSLPLYGVAAPEETEESSIVGEVTTTANLPADKDIAPGKVSRLILRYDKDVEDFMKKIVNKYDRILVKAKSKTKEDNAWWILNSSKGMIIEELDPLGVGDIVKFTTNFKTESKFIEDGSVGEIYEVDEQYFYIKLLHNTVNIDLNVRVDRKIALDYITKL